MTAVVATVAVVSILIVVVAVVMYCCRQSFMAVSHLLLCPGGELSEIDGN